MSLRISGFVLRIAMPVIGDNKAVRERSDRLL